MHHFGGKPPRPTSCQLAEGDYDNCLTTNKIWQETYRRLKRVSGARRRSRIVYDFLFGVDKSDPGHLCDTCRLFRSPFNQSRLMVRIWPGLRERKPRREKRGEIRHGVGIDRDTMTARDQIKYDFEALPSQVNFQVELVIDHPSPLDWPSWRLVCRRWLWARLPGWHSQPGLGEGQTPSGNRAAGADG